MTEEGDKSEPITGVVVGGVTLCGGGGWSPGLVVAE